jgi:hypothetical protein
MLDSIKISCFALAYLITLCLEGSRLFFRLPVRMVIIFGMGFAGFVTHTLYLAHRSATIADGSLPLSSWYDWYLVAAWIIAASYLLLLATRPETSVGMFLLPLTLLLIGIAYPLRDKGTFQRDQAIFSWQTAHGVALLLGMVTVTLGFAAGVMYLIQSYRLKHHLRPRQGFRLPSLEWLQKVNQQMLFYSTFLFALGLLSGIILNAVRRGQSTGAVPWSDSVVISSGLLLLWLVGSSTFEVLYKPAQQGRKVAYLTVASFGFLVIVLGMLVFGTSAHAPTHQPASTGKTACGRSLEELTV